MNIRLSVILISVVSIFSAIAAQSEDQSCEYFSPLRARDMLCFSDCEARTIGKYGDFRSSDTYGHKHAGIDIEGDFREYVYSIGKGEVVAVFREFPHKTVYIRHSGPTGTFTSVYIHIEDIQVEPGDMVSERVVVGRIFDHDELLRSDFQTRPHLHFEIRHNLDDNGDATFTSMSMEELNRYCVDPITFFREGLKVHEQGDYSGIMPGDGDRTQRILHK